MPVDRLLPDDDARALIELTRDVVDREIRPHIAGWERSATFPREVFRTLGRAGLLSLAYPEEFGGGGVPYEVYLQVLEEIASASASIAVGVSVHTLACYPLAAFGSEEQRKQWLPEMLGGELLGAYCLSEAAAGSDAAALTTRAVLDEDGADGPAYVVDGTKSWITHGGEADFYTLMARTSPDGSRGITCLLVDADTPGVTAGPPEDKMGLTASRTSPMHFESARIPVTRRIGAEGQGFPIAMSALDGGRLGIAACAVGLAQAALDLAVDYARERRQFGKPIVEFQGLSFLLADMAAAVDTARAAYLDAARRRDRGLPSSRQASVAKLVATDAAMKVTTDAVQVLGGNGYTRDYPAERYMREAKVMQIFEGTNQIQRMVISRHLTRG